MGGGHQGVGPRGGRGGAVGRSEVDLGHIYFYFIPILASPDHT